MVGGGRGPITRRVAGGGRVEQALGARWQLVGGGRGRIVSWGGSWWEEGKASGGSGRQENLKMYLFTFLLWAGVRASGGGRVSRSPWAGPQCGEPALHLGLERKKLWLPLSPGCHPSILMAWLRGPRSLT